MGNRPVKFVQSYLWFFCAILFLLAVFSDSTSVKIYTPTHPPPHIHVWLTVVGSAFCPVIGEIDDSLKALKEKQQRTVYRLTLVKGWNTEDIDAYSSLFSHGEPDFIEIKGVTYCGSSATSKLTMENVPWHADVKAFSEALAQKSEGRYELACEHVHSCCVLLARVDKFKINGLWFTWIDYEKFHDLVASGKPFDSRDYMAVTPSWAVYGADEGGFDPGQLRYRKERHHKK